MQYLYQRIENVRQALDFYGIDIGTLPSLYLPTLTFPSLIIDWDLPGIIWYKTITRTSGYLSESSAILSNDQWLYEQHHYVSTAAS